MIQVRTRLPESDEDGRTIRVDLEIQFAAQTVQYKQERSSLPARGATSGFPEPFRPNCRTSRSNHQVADAPGEERDACAGGDDLAPAVTGSERGHPTVAVLRLALPYLGIIYDGNSASFRESALNSP